MQENFLQDFANLAILTLDDRIDNVFIVDEMVKYDSAKHIAGQPDRLCSVDECRNARTLMSSIQSFL